MKPPRRLDLIPAPGPNGVTYVAVRESDFTATPQHLRDQGARVVAFDVRGASYRLNVIMPPALRRE